MFQRERRVLRASVVLRAVGAAGVRAVGVQPAVAGAGAGRRGQGRARRRLGDPLRHHRLRGVRRARLPGRQVPQKVSKYSTVVNAEGRT